MVDLVDITIPANGQTAAEALGPKSTAASPAAPGFGKFRAKKPRSQSSACAIGALPRASSKIDLRIIPHPTAVHGRWCERFASLCGRDGMARYIRRVQTRSSGGVLSGCFIGCIAYPDGEQLTVVLRHRRSPRLRRPFPVVALDPPTIEIEDPQNYEGCVPITRGTAEAWCSRDRETHR